MTSTMWQEREIGCRHGGSRGREWDNRWENARSRWRGETAWADDGPRWKEETGMGVDKACSLEEGGGGTNLLLALVVWPLTMRSLLDGSHEIDYLLDGTSMVTVITDKTQQKIFTFCVEFSI